MNSASRFFRVLFLAIILTPYVITLPDAWGQPQSSFSAAGRAQSDPIVEAWVRHYASGMAPSADDATAVTVDAAGNVYVTGRSAGTGTLQDYVTIKYTSDGVKAWVARYNGPANANDEPSAIAVDDSGNVVVTGFSTRAGTSSDYATIKYNAEGQELWKAFYDRSAASADSASALALDDSGNVYVTGGSTWNNSEYATIKYNSSGVEQWVALYDAAGGATAIAVDDSGNVYVTGTSSDTGTIVDYATVKYSAAGDEQWSVRFNGPGDSDDRPTALAVDGSGNVAVTGWSTGVGTGYDYATLRYNAAGQEEWAERYNGPGNADDRAVSLVIDDSGNVCVTGFSGGAGTFYDYATIKYTPSGEEQWVARYDGPGNSIEWATDLAVDRLGNLYVTGKRSDTAVDYATVKYSPAGAVQWVVSYSGPGNDLDGAVALGTDDSGNVVVTGSSVGSGTSDDIATIKYTTDGEVQWAARYDGPGSSLDYAAAIAVGDSGSVYVTGRSAGSSGSHDYVTIRYGADGDEEWIARFDSPGGGDDEPRAIAVDGEGNIIVTGASDAAGTSGVYATIKYDAAGGEQWVAFYEGAAKAGDQATALAVDGEGNIYVTGASIGANSMNDFATVKYNAGGEEQWVARYDYPVPFSWTDYPRAIAVDDTGNVYVTGESGLSGTATIKYDPSGAERWTVRFEGGDNAVALAVDDSGNVYVAGESAAIKYNAAGEKQWRAGYDGNVRAMVVDDSGNVYVTGYGTAAGTWNDYATVKYDAAGATQWVVRFNGPSNSNDYAFDIDIVAPGIICVTGETVVQGSYTDWITIWYNAAGVELGIARYNGPGYSRDGVADMAVDDAGDVFVTGWSDVRNGTMFTTVKYGLPVVTAEDYPLLPAAFRLEQNFPNPFNPFTTIRFSVPRTGAVRLTVYDLLGRVVATPVDEVLGPGTYERSFDAGRLSGGVYFYRMRAGAFLETKKFILMR